jgi:hypothetical protein
VDDQERLTVFEGNTFPWFVAAEDVITVGVKEYKDY